MHNISFGEFNHTYKQLTEALTNHTSTYKICQYCAITTYTSNNEKTRIPLKPNDIVTVIWDKGTDVYDPTFNKVTLLLKPKTEETSIFIKWTGSKLINWLSRNTSNI